MKNALMSLFSNIMERIEKDAFCRLSPVFSVSLVIGGVRCCINSANFPEDYPTTRYFMCNIDFMIFHRSNGHTSFCSFMLCFPLLLIFFATFLVSVGNGVLPFICPGESSSRDHHKKNPTAHWHFSRSIEPRRPMFALY